MTTGSTISVPQPGSYAPGSLKINFGCVRSGKSTAMISELTRAADVGHKVAYFNHSSDIRLTESSDNVVTTHNSGFQKLSKKIAGFKCSSLNDANFEGYRMVGIDEGQFFDDIVPVVRDLVLKKGVHVIIASLDYDFYLQPFGTVSELSGLCSPGNLNKLAAICEKCDRNSMTPAGYSMKIIGGKESKDVGGPEKYIPVCLGCYMKHNTYFK